MKMANKLKLTKSKTNLSLSIRKCGKSKMNQDRQGLRNMQYNHMHGNYRCLKYYFIGGKGENIRHQ